MRSEAFRTSDPFLIGRSVVLRKLAVLFRIYDGSRDIWRVVVFTL